MTWAAMPGVATRLAPSSHAPWTPLPYQLRAVDFLTAHYAAGLPLKPGGRKTSITLAAFSKLKAEGKARRMLVVAPLRVCRQTWRQEAAKWTDFNHLKFSLLHGPKKDKLVREIGKADADVYLINYEGLAWLSKKFFGRPLPFDVVVFDELTKMQNAQAERHKEIRPRLKGVKYRWGLTGSLFAKGHMGIFGQQRILDDGAALGRYITHYRDTYFQVGFNGFDYDLLPGSEKRIIDKIAPYWFYMDEKDYAQLPPLVDVPRIAEMGPVQKKLYKQMKDEALLALPDGLVTGANAGAVYSKLAQLANGAIYLDDHRVAKVHDLKLDMLDELTDELDGEPLMIAYEFNHDLDRIREWHQKKYGTELPWLGKGTTSKNEDRWVRQWNRGELPILAVHPASAGHGLNMQGASACNVAWFSITWDWELYDQLIRRIRRDGSQAIQIFNHLLIIRGTLDETKLTSVRDKDFTESRLVSALNTELLRDSQNGSANEGESTMVARLSRPGDAQNTAAPQPAQQVGWGAPQQQPADDGQRQRIQETIAPQQDRSAAAASAFTGGVQQQVQQVANTDYGPTGETGAAQPAPNQGGWGPPQGQPQQAQQPVQQQDQEPTQAAPAGGWGQPTQAAPQVQQPVQQQDQEPASEPDKPISKMTKAELLEHVAQLEAGGAGTDDSVLQRTLIMARAKVLAAVIMSSPDAELADIIGVARECEDYLMRG